jgi:hypothetical protein
MPKVRTQYEPFAWWLARERVGADLREYYATTSQELPSQVHALVKRLGDAIEGNRFREESSPDAPLLSKLDAIEGNQLLRACGKRLRALGSFR